ncbi:gamma-glutamyl-gamma-aminobutyrate hydrolase family protein [Paenibacillus sp. GCM10023248]|uniref:gamma-glutamyl-gamma-aminobutyrate hydrolase family protein n=1 Tax=unclassified Paenibacillus TaxID=185978 RepID=UPI002377F5A0|nr:gamma-glutamyl-gamma-aminobutyrate hydrolase family protein [Paenibacillus sp. MAHUQ-63]MDD9269010.1 gamma-glutamyl-gamma-aminobutyrate hydrolase family protein [Paenibacillus sp. MAHUQ-63]
MRKPLIGVLPLVDTDKDSYWMLAGYMKGIEEAGGIGVMLPMTADPEVIRTLAGTFDGFLFTGGHDINPELYGEAIDGVCGELCEERDVMEKLLFDEVLKLDKPAFGICRGLQLFNALLGGTLYQDIPAQRSAGKLIAHKQQPPYSEPVHAVVIADGNPLYEIVGKESLMVNSYHHQGIKQLSEQLQAVAYAEDELIEAVAMPGKKFVMAVQWHPEFCYQIDEPSFRLFAAFVSACGQ